MNIKTSALLFFVLPFQIYAQDLSGVWKGYLKNPESQLVYEITINDNSQKAKGYAMTIYTKDGIENIGVKNISVTQRKKEILLEDGELIYHNFSTPPKKAKLLGTLAHQKNDTAEILSGQFRTRSLDFRDHNTYEGNIYLVKQPQPGTTAIIAKLTDLNLQNTLAFPVKRQKNTGTIKTNAGPVVSRKTEIIRDIFFSSDSLVLNLYDNGNVDGDTVSLLLNGRYIMTKAGLTTEAKTIMIPSKLNNGDSLLLLMYAENLGRIPPNTGLLIITDGTVRHEIRFEGDLQKSSGIILKKKARN